MLEGMRLRIGTWNMEGRWSDEHRHLLAWQQCDVWLLTEVSEKSKFPGYVIHPSRESISKGVRWASIAVADKYEPAIHSDPHPASCMVTWSGVTFISSVLPWNSSGASWRWPGKGTAERTGFALQELTKSLAKDTVWGGDWNNALEGPYTGSSKGARALILREARHHDLQVPTKVLPHRLAGLRSIDHIPVPGSWTAESLRRVPGLVDDSPLSDHDIYVVDVETASAQTTERDLASDPRRTPLRAGE